MAKQNRINKILTGVALVASMAGAAHNNPANAQDNNKTGKDSHLLREARLRTDIHSTEIDMSRIVAEFVVATGKTAEKRDSLLNTAGIQLNDAATAMAQRTTILESAADTANSEDEFTIIASLAPGAEYIRALIDEANKNLHAADSVNQAILRTNIGKTR